MSPISSLPHKLLRHILEYLSNEELYDIMPVSTEWNATASQVVAHSFRSQHLVMWIDQEGGLPFNISFKFRDHYAGLFFFFFFFFLIFD